MDNIQNNSWQEPEKGNVPQQSFPINTAADISPIQGSVPVYNPGGIPQQTRKPDTVQTKKMKENFHIFGLASFLYACLYAFCMYRNSSGVTYPFFVAGSLFYICFCFAKLEISLKKGSSFYMVSMMLLAVSTFCTDDGRIVALNKLGVFLLTISFLLSVLYDTRKWDLGKYLGTICQTVFMAIGELGRPFEDAHWYMKNKMNRKNSKLLYMVLGLVIALPIFTVVFLLLVSADAVFRDMTERILEHFSLGNVMLVLVMWAFMFLASYCILSYLCKKSINPQVKDHRKGEPIIAITIATLLSLLYMAFSAIQIVYLFLGKMTLPSGYTYAEYAREGFFQLLAVSVLNLIFVLIGLGFFKESKLLKGILTVMSLCTYIMIASSAMRMIIYIRWYYLTFLRIFVLWSLVVLFLVFTGIIISILKESFPLYRYCMVVVTVCYLILSFSHPDYWIAKVNVAGMNPETHSEFFEGDAYTDYRFLSKLSADAAPVLIGVMQEQGYDLNAYYLERPWEAAADAPTRKSLQSFGYYYLGDLKKRNEHISFRTFNVSRYMAELQIERATNHGK